MSNADAASGIPYVNPVTRYAGIPDPGTTDDALRAALRATRENVQSLTGQVGQNRAVTISDLANLLGLSSGQLVGALTPNRPPNPVQPFWSVWDGIFAQLLAEARAEIAQTRAIIEHEQQVAITDLNTTLSAVDTSLRTDLNLEVNNRITAVQNESATRQTGDSNLAGQIMAVTAAYQSGDATTMAAVATEQLARTSADSALAGRIDTVTAEYKAGDSVNAAAIVTESAARANADSALSGRLDTLSASVGGNAAAIANEAVTRATADTSFASQLTSITAIASQQRVYVQSTPPPASAQQAGVLWIDTSHQNLIKSWDGSAWVAYDDGRIAATVAAITTEQNARATADDAMTQTLTTHLSMINSNTAAINNEALTRANADSSLSSQISTLSTSVNDNSAAITNEQIARTTQDSTLAANIQTVSVNLDNATATGGIQMYAGGVFSNGVAAQINLYVSATGTRNGPMSYAGMSMIVTGSGQGRVQILSDQFVVYNSNLGTNQWAFLIDGDGIRWYGKMSGQLLDAQSITTDKLTARIINVGTLIADNIIYRGHLLQDTATRMDTAWAGGGTAGQGAWLVNLGVYSEGGTFWVEASVDVNHFYGAFGWGTDVAAMDAYLVLCVDGNPWKGMLVPVQISRVDQNFVTARTRGHFAVSGSIWPGPGSHSFQLVAWNLNGQVLAYDSAQIVAFEARR